MVSAAKFVSATALRQHVLDLGRAFGVRVVERTGQAPDEAIAIPDLRLVVVAPVTDETQYAVALHELGHVLAPLGSLTREKLGRPARARHALTLEEEEAAWDWAAHHALVWTPLMQSVREMTFATYVATAPPEPKPARPTRPTRVNNSASTFAAQIRWGKKR